MSGHSKWHSIKQKKGATDAKRGQVFTKHAKLIAVAAREGGSGDPDMNPSLRVAIENARLDNMPKTNIDRAIKRGTGEDKDAAQISEIFYEGYGPNGIAMYIQSLTDNKNRTVSALKNILSKGGGSLGGAGSVGFLFKRRGLITINIDGQDREALELAAIDAGAQDVKLEENILEVYTNANDLFKVKKALEENGVKIESAELTFMPDNYVSISDENAAKKILELMDEIEEDEDVVNVFSNFDISREMMEKLK